MSIRYLNKSSVIFPFITGIILGLAAKLVDTPDITSTFPIFEDIFARFGIWIWSAALLAVFSKKAPLAALRTFMFFTGMLSAYYSYTIVFLKFFPKSQIILWSVIATFTPVCGFAIWHIRKKGWYTNILASLPLIILFSEWYLTGKDNLLLFTIYTCMALSLLIVFPTNRKRLFSLLLAFTIAFIWIQLIQNGMAVNPYAQLLNI